MIIERVTGVHSDFTGLTKLLDQYLETMEGNEHDFYNQYNATESLHYCLIIYINEIAVGCGAIKTFDKKTMEVKRMFVHPDARGKGVAKELLYHLENWAIELGTNQIVLETSTYLKNAMRLYKSNGYAPIANYPPYIDVPESVCFKKALS